MVQPLGDLALAESGFKLRLEPAAARKSLDDTALHFTDHAARRGVTAQTEPATDTAEEPPHAALDIELFARAVAQPDRQLAEVRPVRRPHRPGRRTARRTRGGEPRRRQPAHPHQGHGRYGMTLGAALAQGARRMAVRRLERAAEVEGVDETALGGDLLDLEVGAREQHRGAIETQRAQRLGGTDAIVGSEDADEVAATDPGDARQVRHRVLVEAAIGPRGADMGEDMEADCGEASICCRGMARATDAPEAKAPPCGMGTWAMVAERPAPCPVPCPVPCPAPAS